MRFSINPSGKTYDFEPTYSKQDQSFLTEPDAISDFAIMIKGAYTSQDVSLTTTTAYCISGFNPQWKWIHTKLSFPAAIKGSLHVVFDGVAIPGTGMDCATYRETYFDGESGIICIGDPTITEQTQNIEFTRHTVASIMNQEFAAVWIKPRFLTWI